MKQKIENLLNIALEEINKASDKKSLEICRIKYLAKKSEISVILKSIGSLEPDDRAAVGKIANLARKEITEKINEKKEILNRKITSEKLKEEYIDITLPGKKINKGCLHIITKTLYDIETIFNALGFAVAEGPEIENDYYNYEALNIPEHHPARDMHDTFYIDNNILLRTHTSPVQIRVMEKEELPVKIIVPGKVYRRDADISHSPMFHQVEGLWVDEGVTFCNLKYVLKTFFEKFFEKKLKLRFRPSFFPFTEPSTEVDISCVICDGEGCRLCSYAGWIEVLGAGMVDPEVFKSVNVDPEKYTGLAFGLGVDRLAMLRHGISDIRLFFENDIRFLTQF